MLHSCNLYSCSLILPNFCSNWSYIFRNRFCLHIAGIDTFSVLSSFLKIKILVNTSRIPPNVAGAESGWDASSVQSSFRGRGCEWCNICCAFQCNSELWCISYQNKHSFAVCRQFLISAFVEHCVGSCSESLSLSLSRFLLAAWFTAFYFLQFYLQAGLLSAYIIKKLYFGRFVKWMSWWLISLMSLIRPQFFW